MTDTTETRLGTPSELVDLSGRVVVVTGAGGGIGSGIARRMLDAGATVVAHSRNSALAADLEGRVTDVRADLTEERSPGEVVRAAMSTHGRIDGLVNNAGVQPIAQFTDLTDAQWFDVINTNLTAVHRLTHAVAKVMTGQEDGGSIVHIASIEARHPTPVHGHYATSKAGLVMHARAAALAYGPSRIRVNSVSPGLIGRPGIDEQWPEGVARWNAAAPLGRLGTSEDIGDACVFLCSPLSRWITGVDLVVDGGVLTNTTW